MFSEGIRELQRYNLRVNSYPKNYSLKILFLLTLLIYQPRWLTVYLISYFRAVRI